MNISVIIPARNEEKSIGLVLSQIKDAMRSLDNQYEIIVVDDGSQDKTVQIAQEEGDCIVSHEYNRGYGAALKSGINSANYDYILIVDADGSYPIKEIPLLIEQANKADMVVGSRTGKNVNIPLFRRPAKAILNFLANYLSETRIPDLNSGFRLIKKEIVSKFYHILPNGFSFTTTITLAMIVNGYRVVYVPIDYYKRKGKSKIHPIKDTMNFILLIIRTIIYFNPLKIFLPLSGLFFLAGLGVLFCSYYFAQKVMDITTILLIITAIQIAMIGLLADLIDKRIQR